MDAFTKFSVKNTQVWIDPLDGTNEFTRGNVSAVTILVGLAIDGIPKLGVVHYPFESNEKDCKGLTLFGSVEHGAFKLKFDHLAKNAENT